MRWELRTCPFLRTAGFFADTVHALLTRERTLMILHDALALTLVEQKWHCQLFGAQDREEKFRCAMLIHARSDDAGWSCLPGRYLAQPNKPPAFNITFSDQTSTIQYAWTRVGASARVLIGA